jgi:hypothetical protein
VPSNRTRTKRGVKLSMVPDIWQWLNDEITELDSLEVLMLYDADRLKIWREYRDEILEHWIESKPGTRPRLWWAYDAPRDREFRKGTYLENTFAIARRQLGGAGVPAWQQLSYVPVFDKGIPSIWLDYDADDPPVFESEFCYFNRYGLLNKKETVKHDRPEVVKYYVDDNFREIYRLDKERT